MSDSDEAAFASADEGDVDTGTSSTATAKSKASRPSATSSKKNSSSRKEGQEKAKEDSAQEVKKGPQQVEEQAKPGRGRGQQAQKGKKKGRGGGQTSPREPAVAKPGGSAASQEAALASPAKDKSPAKTKDGAAKGAELPKAGIKKEEVEKPSPTKEGKPTTPVTTDAETKSPLRSDNSKEDQKVSALRSPESQSIPADQREQNIAEQEEVPPKTEDSAKTTSGGGWGWGGWGSSLLSAATNSVQTFTSQVGDGFNTLMDTVEVSLGAPTAEELARAHAARKAQAEETKAPSEEKAPPTVTKEPESGEAAKPASPPEADAKPEADVHKSDSWFDSWGVGDLARKVQDTGKSLASKGSTLMTEGFDAVENLAAGGIDVLETIGKKTYSTLSEHDPAFRKTRDFLSAKGNKPNLSSVLREAKAEAELKAEEEKETDEARKVNFGLLFDNYQGIAHLEALEMLSTQSEKKVHSLLKTLGKSDVGVVKTQLIAIKAAFEVGDGDEDTAPKEADFTSLVTQCVNELQLGTAPDKLQKVHDMVRQWIQDFDTTESHEGESVKSIHQRGIQALAELTAKGVEQFHKAGELVLMEQDAEKDCTERAHSLARLTGVLCHEGSTMSTEFAACLNKIAEQDSEDVTGIVTSIYLEASNSNTYIQDAFQLLLPVLQHAALEHFIRNKRLEQQS